MLLLIYCLMYFPLLVGVLCIFYFALVCVLSIFAIILKRKGKLFGLQMSCYYKCSVTLPHGVAAWSAVCDYNIS